MKPKIFLQKRIKDNQYTMNWLLVGFFVAVGILVIWKNLIAGVLSILIFQLIMNLNTARRLDELNIQLGRFKNV